MIMENADAMETFQQAKEGLLNHMIEEEESHMDSDDGNDDGNDADGPAGSSRMSLSLTNEEMYISQILKSLHSIQSNSGRLQGSNSMGFNNNDRNDLGNDHKNDDGDSTGIGMIRTSMKYNNKIKKATLRTLLQSNKDITEFIDSLSTLISHRNAPRNEIYEDRHDHDDDGDPSEKHNLEGIHQTNNDKNWTLSLKALMAGRTYIELSAMEGSWGAGWIDVGVMRNVEALIKRWGEECRGKTLQTVKVKRGRDASFSACACDNMHSDSYTCFDLSTSVMDSL